jgi:hypothetical protein
VGKLASAKALLLTQTKDLLMNSLTSNVSVINMDSPQALKRLNAGNLTLDAAGTPVTGAILASTLFGEGLAWDTQRPQILLCCDAPEFYTLVQELHTHAEVGVMRAELPDGRYLAAIIYESDEQGLWVCFDPHSKAGQALLQDWRQHKSMHITFICGGVEFSNRQALTSSVIPKLLAVQKTQRCAATRSTLKGRMHQFAQNVDWMHQVAQARGTDKKRLFVMLVDVPMAVMPHVPTLH